MSISSILYGLITRPLVLFFEVIFAIACQLTWSPGASIIFVSLIMNILLLPLYRRADAIQEEEKNIELKMKPGVDHIKKTFTGDERFMMLQTYYRQNNYKPSYVVRGSLPLLLEIPFFIAAYKFLSELKLLQGISFGPIPDLGAPDGMLVLFGITINLLPILMTLINIISSMIYTRGYPLKTKIQLYGMAAIFLVLLYKSPAGLVFYWTLNNIFSLIKNICVRIKLGEKFKNTIKEFIVKIKSKKEDKDRENREKDTIRVRSSKFAEKRAKRNKKIAKCKEEKERMFSDNKTHSFFWFGSVFLTLLCGALIPSSVISTSPEEFLNTEVAYPPLHYIFNSVLIAAGIFIVWFGVFYLLANKDARKKIGAAVWAVSGVFVINYMFFATKMGNLSAILKFDYPVSFDIVIQILQLAFVIAFGIVLVVIFLKKNNLVSIVYSAGILAICVMVFTNVRNIQSILSNISEKQIVEEEVQIPISRNGKNVVVMMIDRAMSGQLPYIFKEKPELEEKFSGFTYYPNAVSYGTFTNTGSPALFGGYDYIPEKMNEREGVSLKDKHNEALQVMPSIFNDEGFKVTVCDPPYAGYKWIPDLSIYDKYENVKAYITEGRFTDYPDLIGQEDHVWERNFFCYSLMKVSPILLQPVLYNGGLYNEAEYAMSSAGAGSQNIQNSSKAYGMNTKFMNAYLVLNKLPELTKIEEGDGNTFMMMDNDTPHEPTLLQKPDYVPQREIDNTDYDKAHPNDYTINGIEMHMDNLNQITHYHVNVATYMQLTKWFDYLRENDVYDNTRIILVSDHGRGLDQFKERNLDNGFDIEWFNCFLMVKDFNQEGFKTDYTFMTNGDVPELATKDVVKDAKNPFTGRPISGYSKEGPQMLFQTNDWNVTINNGNKFLPGDWYSVHDDIFDLNNWKFEGKH